jgi:hypothetical protein
MFRWFRLRFLRFRVKRALRLIEEACDELLVRHNAPTRGNVAADPRMTDLLLWETTAYLHLGNLSRSGHAALQASHRRESRQNAIRKEPRTFPGV